MKRRNWIWFLVSGILAVLAGVVAIAFLLNIDGGDGGSGLEPQMVVVATSPIAAGTIVRVDQVALEERAQIPDGAFFDTAGAVNHKAVADIGVNEVVVVQDIEQEVNDGGQIIPEDFPEDKIAVALPADDILSQWGAVVPGDHVDVLFTLDVILETDMYPEETLRIEEGEVLQRVERDQSMDNVSVLTVQNLEVLAIIDEPQLPAEEQAQAEGEATTLPRRAMVLAINPQDAVILKYLRDNAGIIDVALRNRENGTLFDTEPVNINYLILRYGIVLPEPLQ